MSALGEIRDWFRETLSTEKNSIKITTHSDDSVIQREAYSIRQSINILTGETARILFDCSELTEDIILKPFRVHTTTGTVDMSLTKDFTYTSADTPYPVINRYGLHLATTELKNYTNLTGLVVSSEPLTYTIGESSSNQFSGGGVTAGSEIFVFEKNGKYLLSFKNNAGESVKVSLQFDWFENTVM